MRTVRLNETALRNVIKKVIKEEAGDMALFMDNKKQFDKCLKSAPPAVQKKGQILHLCSCCRKRS